jgi:hypothetical protein
MRDFDDNLFPLAYLITLRYYGTWLHGDGRGSYRRSAESRRVRVPPRPRLVTAETEQLIFPFNSIRVSGRLSKTLFEKYVFIAGLRCMRSTQERIMCTQASQLQCAGVDFGGFKSYATRALGTAGLDKNIQPWSRHGSTVYLWKERHLNKGIEYVVLG